MLPAAVLHGPGRLAYEQRCQPRAHGHCRPQPVLPDARPGPASLCRRPFHRRGHHCLAGAHYRRILAGVRGQPPGPYAAHAGLLPCRDQGPALHPHGQQRHACRLRHRGAAVPELGAYGSRLRPCHYADYDVHHAAALLLPARGAQAQGCSVDLRGLLPFARRLLLRELAHQVLPRRLLHHPHGCTHHGHYGVLVQRHGGRAAPVYAAAAAQLPAAAQAPARRRPLRAHERQRRVPDQGHPYRLHRPRYRLLDLGQASQACPRLVVCERRDHGRTAHLCLFGRDVRHRLRVPRTSVPGLQDQPARQCLPASGCSGPGCHRRAAAADA